MSRWPKTSRQSRGYDARWDRLRVVILQRDSYLCQVCLHAKPSRITAAAAVDHIVCKARNGTDDPSNLRAICRACHLKKTLFDSGKKRWPRIGLSGWPIDDDD